MTYAFNGIELTLQPTFGYWIPVEPVGITGDGHFIYPAVQQFTLYWGLMPIEDFNQILNFCNSLGITGTVVASLPQWDGSNYAFYNYSGCTLGRPTVGEYFMEHVREVNLVISNIRV